MTVTINGTSGLAGVDGSTGTPAIQGADTNTGIFFPAADTAAIQEQQALITAQQASLASLIARIETLEQA